MAPIGAWAGSLNVGPMRIDLSAQHPIATLQVQNTGDQPSLTQLDLMAWSQAGAGDVLEATNDLIATPTVFSVAPGQTRTIRVGLRERTQGAAERSYRIFVREIPQAVPGVGLQFALRIGVPIFVAPSDARPTPAAKQPELGWRWVKDIHGCAAMQLYNPATHHERVVAADMASRSGEVLWRATEPAYVLAGSRRTLNLAVCAPSLGEVASLRLTLEGRDLTLPLEAPSLVVVDANSP